LKPLIEMTRSFGMMASNPSETVQLSAGVNWFPVVNEVVRLLEFEVSHQITLRNYGNAAGPRFLTDFLSRILLGPHHPTHNILLTNGTSNAAYLICKLLKETSRISNLVTLDPGYPHYEFLSDQLGLTPNLVFADLTGDLDQLGAMFSDRVAQTRGSVVCIIDPLNPSGRCLSDFYLRKIIETARRRSSYVIVDTVCLMPGDDWRLDKLIGLVNEFDNLFIIGSNSKYAGLAGLRTGICIHPKTETKTLSNAMLLQSLNPPVFGTIANGLIWAARSRASFKSPHIAELIGRSFNKYIVQLFREYPLDFNSKVLMDLNVPKSIRILNAQFSLIESDLKRNTLLLNRFCYAVGLESPEREAGFNALVPLSKVLYHLDEEAFFLLALKNGFGVLTTRNFTTTTDIYQQSWFVRIGLAIPTRCFETAICRFQEFVINQMGRNNTRQSVKN
jgi:aspartate/methionine/tyrosine aminotransferase